MADRTLDRTSAYGSTAWVAQRLGISPRAFRDKRSQLSAEGFPEIDPLMKLYIKADVDAWIEKRRSITDSDKVASGGARPGINLAAL